MTWQIKRIAAEATYSLRQRILWPEKTMQQVMVEGDAAALHLAAYAEDRQIGVISLFATGRDMQFRKLAVLESYQGMGAGTALIHACIAAAREKGAAVLWCNDRQDAAGFYARLGFQIDDAVFMQSGLNYQRAWLQLGRSSADENTPMTAQMSTPLGNDA